MMFNFHRNLIQFITHNIRDREGGPMQSYSLHRVADYMYHQDDITVTANTDVQSSLCT